MTVLRDTTSIVVDLCTKDGTYAVVQGVTPPTTGYVVALADRGFKLDKGEATDSFVLAIWAWVKKVQRRASYESCFVGAWTHEGDLYLDVVKIFQDKALALELAERTGELAIYDLAAGAEIRTSWGRGER